MQKNQYYYCYQLLCLLIIPNYVHANYLCQLHEIQLKNTILVTAKTHEFNENRYYENAEIYAEKRSQKQDIIWLLLQNQHSLIHQQHTQTTTNLSIKHAFHTHTPLKLTSFTPTNRARCEKYREKKVSTQCTLQNTVLLLWYQKVIVAAAAIVFIVKIVLFCFVMILP